MIDAFSRFSMLDRLVHNNVKSKSEAIVTSIITKWIATFGKPSIILVDPDTRLKCKASLVNMCELFNIQLLVTPSKHHQSFGTVDRHIRRYETCFLN